MTEELLSEEQKKRLAYVEAYEKETEDARNARNKAIYEHEEKFKKKWNDLEAIIEQTRAQKIISLRSQGLNEVQVQSMVAAEIASIVERYYAEKDQESRKLVLEPVISFKDWLVNQKEKNPEDPTIDSLLAEASDDPSIDGFLKMPPPNIVMTELVPEPSDQGVDYRRGMFVVIRDRGPRLDVRNNDERNIEAALKIAAQKFDMDKGLMLTGDLAFKRKAAEIAGRLGLKIQNTEPEVAAAYKRGLEMNRESVPIKISVPEVRPGIEGDPIDRAIAELEKPMTIYADKRTVAAADLLGIDRAGDEAVVIPGQRVFRALANIRELSPDIISILSHVDVLKRDGGLSDEELKRLADVTEEKLVEDGKLTREALDITIVFDYKMIEKRKWSPELSNIYKTSGEYVREKEAENGIKTEEKQLKEQVDIPSPAFDDEKKRRRRQVEPELER